MSLIFTSPSTTYFSQLTIFQNPNNTLSHSNKISYLPLKPFKFPKLYPSKPPSFTCNSIPTPTPTPDSETKIAFDYELDESLSDSPWEGAVVYKRDPTVSHLEYCTTLERLGLGKFSTEVSKSRASIMGMRVTKAVKDYPEGTPVLISVDVSRKKKRKLRLDGIVKTVLTLGCNRCGESAAQCVFSNFTVLLSEEPIEEEDVINLGSLFGDSKQNVSASGEDEDDEASIDLEDKLYFPREESEIDISKNIRDMVHVEITITAVCDPKCKGMCLRCGVNLNTSKCRCKIQEEDKYSGPLGNLKNQMQKR